MNSVWLFLLVLPIAIGSLESIAYAETQANDRGRMVPSSDDDVVWKIPKDVQIYRSSPSQFASNDPEIDLAVEIQRILADARRTGDPRTYGMAEARLGRLWNDKRLTGQLLLQRANIKQFNHDFSGALEDLSNFTKASPDAVEALLMTATIRQIQGDYSAALEICQRIESLQLVLGKICSSGVRAMTGQADTALTELKSLESLVLLRNQSLMPFLFQTQADALTRLGRFTEAEQILNSALQLEPGNRFVLAALADIWLELGKFQSAISALSAFKEHDGLIARLAVAQKKASDPGFAATESEILARLEREKSRGEIRHLRELSIFQLLARGDSSAALSSARMNWGEQREPIDTALYVEAAVMQNAKDDLNQVVKWMRLSGYRDAKCIQWIQSAGVSLD
jgi:tetratricopeptide (TPR) repeat protein